MRLVHSWVISLPLAMLGACSGNFDAGQGGDASTDGTGGTDASPDQVIIVVPGADSGKDSTALDAETGLDGGQDSTLLDANAGGETTVDSGPTLTTFSCGVDDGTLTLVDDLSTVSNGSSLGFQGIWIAPNGQGNDLYVLTRRSDENYFFRAYAVNLATGVVSLNTYAGLNPSGSNLRLLDVTTTTVSTTDTSLVLTSYGNGSLAGLQIVQLPQQIGAPLTNMYPVGNLGTIDPGIVGGGRMASMANGDTAWLVSIDGPPNALVIGAGTQAAGQVGNQTLDTSPTTNFNFPAQTPLVDQGGGLYTFESGAGGTLQDTVYAVPDSLGDAGVKGSVGAPDAGGTIFEAKTSATDPSKVLLLGVTLSTSGPGAQIYTARVPPSALTSIYIGPPGFTPGASVSLAEFPVDNYGRSWSNDDFAMVGSPGTGGTGLAMVMIDGNGNVLNGGLIENDGNQIQIGAVQFLGTFSELLGGAMYIAWIEHAAVDGSAAKYARIYAARVTCLPSADGG